jgi:FkbM family methyltransferase
LATTIEKKIDRALNILDRWFGFRNVRGHTFYSKSLYPKSTVLDLGANLGAFSQHIASKYKCNTYLVEASPALFAQINETALVHKYNYAITGKDGFVTFYESSRIDAGNIVAPNSKSTGNTFEVKARSIASLIAEIGLETIDLLKIDIEGAEIELFDNIGDEDLKHFKQITIEFHDSVTIPNVSPKDVNRVIKKLHSMGFYGIAMGKKNFDWLFWNTKEIRLPSLAKFYLSFRKQLTKSTT